MGTLMYFAEGHRQAALLAGAPADYREPLQGVYRALPSAQSLASMNRLTARSAAIRIQEELDLGDTTFAHRLLPEPMAVLQELDPQVHLDEFLQEPATISDERLNAFFLTSIRWRLTELGYRVPEWTDVSPLTSPAYLWRAESLDIDSMARIQARTPREFAVRNLWTHAAKDFSTA